MRWINERERSITKTREMGEEKGKLIILGIFFPPQTQSIFFLNCELGCTGLFARNLSHWAGEGHITSAWESCKNTAVFFALSHWGSQRYSKTPSHALLPLYSPFTYLLSETPSISPSSCPFLHHLSPAHWWLFNSTVRAVTGVRGQFHVSYCLSASWELHLAHAN